MPWSTSNRIVQNKCGAIWFSPLMGKRLSIVENVEGLLSVDASFAPIDSPRSVENVAVSPSSTSMGVTMIPNNIHSQSLTRHCERYSWGTFFCFFLAPACTV